MVSKIFRRSLPPFQCCKTEIVHRPCLSLASWPDRVTQPVPSIALLEIRRPLCIKLPLFPNQFFSSFHHLYQPPNGRQFSTRLISEWRELANQFEMKLR